MDVTDSFSPPLLFVKRTLKTNKKRRNSNRTAFNCLIKTENTRKKHNTHAQQPTSTMMIMSSMVALPSPSPHHTPTSLNEYDHHDEEEEDSDITYEDLKDEDDDNGNDDHGKKHTRLLQSWGELSYSEFNSSIQERSEAMSTKVTATTKRSTTTSNEISSSMDDDKNKRMSSWGDDLLDTKEWKALDVTSSSRPTGDTNTILPMGTKKTMKKKSTVTEEKLPLASVLPSSLLPRPHHGRRPRSASIGFQTTTPTSYPSNMKPVVPMGTTRTTTETPTTTEEGPFPSAVPQRRRPRSASVGTKPPATATTTCQNHTTTERNAVSNPGHLRHHRRPRSASIGTSTPSINNKDSSLKEFKSDEDESDQQKQQNRHPSNKKPNGTIKRSLSPMKQIGRIIKNGGSRMLLSPKRSPKTSKKKSIETTTTNLKPNILQDDTLRVKRREMRRKKKAQSAVEPIKSPTGVITLEEQETGKRGVCTTDLQQQAGTNVKATQTADAVDDDPLVVPRLNLGTSWGLLTFDTNTTPVNTANQDGGVATTKQEEKKQLPKLDLRLDTSWALLNIPVDTADSMFNGTTNNRRNDTDRRNLPSLMVEEEDPTNEEEPGTRTFSNSLIEEDVDEREELLMRSIVPPSHTSRRQQLLQKSFSARSLTTTATSVTPSPYMESTAKSQQSSILMQSRESIAQQMAQLKKKQGPNKLVQPIVEKKPRPPNDNQKLTHEDALRKKRQHLKQRIARAKSARDLLVHDTPMLDAAQRTFHRGRGGDGLGNPASSSSATPSTTPRSSLKDSSPRTIRKKERKS